MTGLIFYKWGKKKDTLSHNLKLYGHSILWYCPSISFKDLKWLSNKCANVYRNLGGRENCISHFRVCRTTLGYQSIKYRMEYNGGCCGYSDQIVKNKLTGHRFWIGFNFGH